MKEKFANLKHWQRVAVYLVIYDYITVVGAYFLALWFRFDCKFSLIPRQYSSIYYETIWIYALACLCIYGFFGLYKSIWRFASFYEMKNTVYANIVSVIAYILVSWAIVVTRVGYRMPISYYVFGIGFQFLFAVVIRFSYRFVLLLRDNKEKQGDLKKILLIGAGSAGRMILRDINFVNSHDAKIVCIIDDNENKWSRQIDGVEVVGGRDKLLWAVEEYGIDEIYIAITTMSPKQKRDLINLCKETHCSIKQLPNIYAEKAGIVTASSLQNITIEDVLGRDTIKLDKTDVQRQIQDKVVIVTGGGGSIGSELCRQIASFGPRQLIIFDIYENNAYDIQLELKKKYPDLNLETIIGSVRDSKRINQVFATYHPDICYHAAAHKHVPLMEDSPCEAIKNNVIGTYKTAYAAMMNGCSRFVLISTDKAVNPTNVMGASKRMCEMVIQTFDKLAREGKADMLPMLFSHSDEEGELVPAEAGHVYNTEYVAVRFGNVLGSNGSVVPLFKRQIAEGGPVTVTHPDIIRYFMTIPEAVSLVMKSGASAQGGEIFVLDMGEPVKIDDLARNMIELAGYKPGIDIEIKYVGLRPGEKLYEEKLMAEEGLKKTENELIHVAEPINIDTGKYLQQLQQLLTTAYENDNEQIVELVRATVPTFKG